MKLLIIEDNSAIIKGLEYSLVQEGFKVDTATEVKQAKIKIIQNSYDLILLDVSLPDGDGFTLCKEIKQKQDVPIIFLTAKDEETDIVQGLDLGADDYITKPFRMRELVSRINTVLRRFQKGEEKKHIIVIQNIKIDINKAKVYREDEEIILTALEYRILSMLAMNKNQVMTREQILEKIWDIAGNFVNDNTLTVYIKRIREKIGDNQTNPQIIKTIRGIGYLVEE